MKLINNYPGYFITQDGRVYSEKRKKWLKISLIDGYTYAYLCFQNKGKPIAIHRLVAQAYIPNPENKPCVNHINGIKSDNRIENLEWVTYSENNLHAYKTGLKMPVKHSNKTKKKMSRMRTGECNPGSKITWEDVRGIREKYNQGCSRKDLSKFYNISLSTVRSIVNLKTWKEID